MKILIIDDDTFSSEEIKKVLKDLPAATLTGCYQDPQEAFQKAINAPDILIIAIEMKEQNGLIIARKFREKLPDLKIILLSRSRYFARNAFDIGAEGYLLKPIDKDKLTKLLLKVG